MKRGVKTHKEEENFDLKVTLFAFAESPVTPKCTMHILKSHLQKSSWASIKMTQHLFVHFVYQARVCRAKGSTSLYYISLSLGFGNIDKEN